LEVEVDVFYAGFVKAYIGFSEGNEIGGKVGLAGLLGWYCEGRGEG
jgi:hypothetical protein